MNNTHVPPASPQGKPGILFRFLHDGSSTLFPTPGFDQDGDLPARNPGRTIDFTSVDDHLSWTRQAMPFLSFCTWEKACRWLKSLREQGARNITLVAIDSSRMAIVDAYRVAKKLGYRNDNQDPRRQLRNHRGEYLICGGYYADSYKLLTVIPRLPWPSALPDNGRAKSNSSMRC